MHPHGSFIWTDLSTFDVAEAKRFYAKVLRWRFEETDEGYWTGFADSSASAALYKMPEFFQKIDMPSFWMSYIAVDDVAAAAKQAQALGGKVELIEERAVGKFALIRDPLGAGFTCYQGELPSALETGKQTGRWQGSELYVSDFSKIATFYSTLFNWQLVPAGESQWTIRTKAGAEMGSIHEATNEDKGDKEYWAAFFQVADLKAATNAAEVSGGEVIRKEAQSTMVYDNQGAYFGLKAGADAPSSKPPKKSTFKWRSLVGLALLYPAILLELNFIWGVLFLFWVIPDLKTGTTYFMEPVSRSENPALYWTIVATWTFLGALMLFV